MNDAQREEFTRRVAELEKLARETGRKVNPRAVTRIKLEVMGLGRRLS